MKYFFTFIFLLFCSVGYAQLQDSVTIKGRVTDYNGFPIDNATVYWQRQNYSSIVQANSNKEGYYMARIPKGKYNSVACVSSDTYPRTAKSGILEADQRLEFWAWDFIADRDTILNIHYHRMEAYGMRVFQIPGAVPAYQIFVRPISLTRMLKLQKEAVCDQKQPKLSQKTESRGPKSIIIGPPADQLKAMVWINGNEVPVLMKQEIKEYFTASEYGNAYLLTVDLPKFGRRDLPYLTFKVELTDLENGDRGEGVYYLEKENYIK